jgi:hypothetical protein
VASKIAGLGGDWLIIPVTLLAAGILWSHIAPPLKDK